MRKMASYSLVARQRSTFCQALSYVFPVAWQFPPSNSRPLKNSSGMWATWVEVGRVMISMVIWVISLAGSIAAICLAVAMDAQTSHLGATALVSFGIVAAAVSDHRATDVAGGSEKALAASGARYLGVLWAWSAISANVAYAFLLDWPYWMPCRISIHQQPGNS